MNCTERAVTFDCAGEALVGVLATPHATVGTTCSTGVIVIVGGPQYRAGSHRQFVLLSRALAAAGYPVLRFDYRGMGDSTGEQRDFLQVTPDIAAAIDAMQRQLPSVERVALWGLCDAASAALLYCHETEDPRVRGLCLLNPWVRSEASLAQTQIKHYYAQRLMQKAFWAKLVRGEIAWAALASLVRSIRVAVGRPGASSGADQAGAASTLPAFQHRMAIGWNGFADKILLLLSGEDYTAKEFLEYAGRDRHWKAALAHRGLRRHDLKGADHTFSGKTSREMVNELTLGWLDDLTRRLAT